jgi:hypothetical protein
MPEMEPDLALALAMVSRFSCDAFKRGTFCHNDVTHFAKSHALSNLVFEVL